LVTDIFRAVGMYGDDGLDVATRILTPIARGALQPAVADALGASVLLGISKPGSSKLRPIGMGDALRRLAMRSVMRQYSTRIRAHFEPLQYAVESKGGAQQVFMTLRGLVERSMAAGEEVMVMRVDAKNAFNCLRREQFLTEVRAHFPELLPGVCAFYLRENVLHIRGPNGKVVTIKGKSGVTQGDVFGPLLFGLGIHPVLVDTMARFGSRGVYVLAYADDIHLVGPPQAVWEAFCFLRAGLRERACLDLSPGKCSAYCPPGSHYPAALLIEAIQENSVIAPESNGFIVLGVPFRVGLPSDGTALLERLQDTSRATSLSRCLEAIVDVAKLGGPHGPAIAYGLLRVCVPGKTLFYAQLSPPEEFSAVATWAEQETVRTWVSIMADGDSTDLADLDAFGAWRRRLLAQSVTQGGAGLISPVSSAPLAYVAGFAAFAPDAARRLVACTAWGGSASVPEELFGTNCYHYAAPVSDAGTSTSSGALALPLLPFHSSLRQLRNEISTALSASEPLVSVWLDEGPELGAQRGLLKALRYAAARAERVELRKLVLAEDRALGQQGLSVLQFDAGVQLGSGMWQRALAGRWHNSLRAEEYSAACRRRFCLSFPGLRDRPRCPFPGCGERLDVYGRHIFACDGPHQQRRDQLAHDEVRDHLFGVCREAGLRPQLETRRLVPGSQARPADVMLPAGHGLGGPQEALGVACLDVSGVRSECDSHRQAGLTAPLRVRHREKAMRTFPPSPEVASAAERDGRAAAQAALAGGASAAEADQASRAAVARTIARRAPLLYLVPIVFSTMGFFYDGDTSCGARATLSALGAYFRRGESERADGAGAVAVWSRWLPRLSAAVERGVWWRINYTLQALNRQAAPTRDEHMALADLTTYASMRAFAPLT
jgi:hypothetical protein